MNTEQQLHFFESLSSLSVLIIGDVMLDRYIWGDVAGISPEAPVPIIRVKKRDYRMGGAANVALNIQSLGANPILCATVGKDEAGDHLLERMDKHKMTQEGILISARRETTIKTRIIADQRHVVRIDEESNGDIYAEEDVQLLKLIEKLLPRCHVVIFEDYDKGTITPQLIDKTVLLAKQYGISTVVDPKKKNFLSYKGVTLMTPNLKELKEGLKIHIEEGDKNQLTEAVKKLKKKLKTNILVTLSEDGVFMDYKSEEISLPAHHRAIVDVSGAGDTVVTIAALCIARGLEAKWIASLSNLGGGLVCQYVGVVPIDKGELQRECTHIMNNQQQPF